MREKHEKTKQDVLLYYIVGVLAGHMKVRQHNQSGDNFLQSGN